MCQVDDIVTGRAVSPSALQSGAEADAIETATGDATIDQWLAAEIAALEDFVKIWRRQQIQDPEDYPETMSMGDWDDQYRCFYGSGYQKGSPSSLAAK